MTNRASEHVPELDGLRAVAIGLVFLHHFGRAAQTGAFTRITAAIFGACWIGVDLFFVLSGFLITGICLDHKGPGFLKAFYARRALRILPPYLLVLAVITATSYVVDHHAPAGWPWLVTFTTNAAMAYLRSGDIVPETASHLWSLAIEEQFYVLWPLCVFLLSRRAAATAAGIAILLALLARIAVVSEPAVVGYSATPTRMDTLALGALLACAVRGANWHRIARMTRQVGNASLPLIAIALAILCLLISSQSTPVNFYSPAMRTVGFSVVAVVFAILLAGTLTGKPDSPLRTFLRRPAVRSVGRYSYAMYLFHIPIDVWLRPLKLSPPSLLVVGSLASYGLARLSWRFVEAPALRYKARFSYRAAPPTEITDPLAVSRVTV